MTNSSFDTYPPRAEKLRPYTRYIDVELVETDRQIALLESACIEAYSELSNRFVDHPHLVHGVLSHLYEALKASGNYFVKEGFLVTPK